MASRRVTWPIWSKTLEVVIDDCQGRSWVANINATRETNDDRRNNEPSRARRFSSLSNDSLHLSKTPSRSFGIGVDFDLEVFSDGPVALAVPVYLSARRPFGLDARAAVCLGYASCRPCATRLLSGDDRRASRPAAWHATGPCAFARVLCRRPLRLSGRSAHSLANRRPEARDLFPRPFCRPAA
jgi:hypothetical protein